VSERPRAAAERFGIGFIGLRTDRFAEMVALLEIIRPADATRSAGIS